MAGTKSRPLSSLSYAAGEVAICRRAVPDMIAATIHQPDFIS